ncbi:MAG: glycoside hydrolase family 5 protein [Clostridia bacterium]|nr:glycoside hydrolase family 5 protein [Clostridia bacterium]
MRFLPLLICLLLALLPVASLASDYVNIVTLPVIDVKPWSVPSNESMRFSLAMSPGWNLGNGLDCYDETGTIIPGVNDLGLESMWSGAPITESAIRYVYYSGFKTIRIPVSWHDHLMDSAYTINPDWMLRVKQVVDWSLNVGLNVILDVHHDNTLEYIYPDNAHFEQSSAYLTAMWTQICATFANYDQHLIFEGLNEPRLVGTDVEWMYDYTDPDCVEATDCINRLNQLFVNTVRESGGRNADRYLMIPAYAASPYTAILDNFTLPTDTAKDRLLVSVHAYIPYDFAMYDTGTDYFDIEDTNQTSVIDDAFNALYDTFIKKGIPVIIGEFGCIYNGNLRDRLDFTAYYCARAYERGLTCVIWDNGNFNGGEESFGLLDRSQAIWIEQELIDTLMRYCK